MTLKVGDVISYNAGKASGRILSIKGGRNHKLFAISNGDELLDLDSKVGRPGGVTLISSSGGAGTPIDQPDRPGSGGFKKEDPPKTFDGIIPDIVGDILGISTSGQEVRPSGETGPAVSGVPGKPPGSGI